jgi:hypothetical protein
MWVMGIESEATGKWWDYYLGVRSITINLPI